jgi:hypothetical protein
MGPGDSPGDPSKMLVVVTFLDAYQVVRFRTHGIREALGVRKVRGALVHEFRVFEKTPSARLPLQQAHVQRQYAQRGSFHDDGILQASDMDWAVNYTPK